MSKQVLSLILIVLLTGCTAIGVPVTTNPDKKVAYAYQLFDGLHRPIPAEGLLIDAIEIYKADNNMLGLAEAYRAFGFFYRSPSIRKNEKFYIRWGFKDGGTYEQRYAKSIELFQKAESIYVENKMYDSLVNIHLNMGFTFELADNNSNACKYFAKSIESNIAFAESNPGVDPIVPEGFSSYKEYADKHIERLKCP